MHMKHLSAIAGSLVMAMGLLAGCGEETAPGNADAGRTAETGAELREVTLSVPDMNCPMCPITVRKALASVDGVLDADASLEGKQARVVFDPARTGTGALIAAVGEAGFSASLREPRDE